MPKINIKRWGNYKDESYHDNYSRNRMGSVTSEAAGVYKDTTQKERELQHLESLLLLLNDGKEFD